MRNVEIKAKVDNIVNLINAIKALKPQIHEVITQNDIFYFVPSGRLKLRKFENGSGELIFYERPDTQGPKMCSYEKSCVSAENFNTMNSILEKALGMRTTVKKVRHLFIIGQTRVHVDSVEDLGDFMELEVVLGDLQTPEDGEKIAYDLMDKLQICKENLISSAYADMLTN